MTLTQRILLQAGRHSYRFSTHTFFVAQSNGHRIPVCRGVGATMLQDRPGTFDEVVRFIYGRFRGTFVDVGANIGKVMLAVLRVDSKIPYVAFEPSLRAADYLRELIDENGLSDTHAVFPVALADKPGTAFLRFNSPADVSATISATVRPSAMYSRRVPIALATGDEMLAETPEIGAIKIDAEGVEPLVLRGLRKTLARTRPALIIEILPFAHLESGNYNRAYFGDISEEERTRIVETRKSNLRALEELLRGELDYEFFKIRGSSAVPADPWATELKDQDFLALPRERA